MKKDHIYFMVFQTNLTYEWLNMNVLRIFLQADHRTMAAFVLAMIVNNYLNGQVSASPYS